MCAADSFGPPGNSRSIGIVDGRGLSLSWVVAVKSSTISLTLPDALARYPLMFYTE